jgi:hypothetical protein
MLDEAAAGERVRRGRARRRRRLPETKGEGQDREKRRTTGGYNG